MITTAILYLIYGVVYAATYPIRYFPDVSVPQGVIDSISFIGPYLIGLDKYFPVSDLILILGLMLAVDTAIFAYKAIMWLVRRFPTQS